MDTIEQETDEERAERIQRWRLHRALVEAPDLLAHVRSIAIGGRSERGETLGEWTAPMRITAADDVDDVYGQLIDWVVWAAEELKLSPASVSVVAWSIDEKVHGFRAETTIEAARLLTSINTGWMLTHEAQLEGWANYMAFRDDVLQLLWSLRAKYPMQKGREKVTTGRECPACGEHSVSASWWSEEMREVDVSCAACGYQLEADVKVRIGKKRVGVLDLLDWETRENRECTCRYPGDPIADCPVHHPDGVESSSLPQIAQPAAPVTAAPESSVVLEQRAPRVSVSFVGADADPELRQGEVVCHHCFLVKPCPCEDGQ